MCVCVFMYLYIYIYIYICTFFHFLINIPFNNFSLAGLKFHTSYSLGQVNNIK